MEILATRLEKLRARGPRTPDRFEFVEQRDQAFREIAAGEAPRPLFATTNEFVALCFVLGKKLERARNFQFVIGRTSSQELMTVVCCHVFATSYCIKNEPCL